MTFFGWITDVAGVWDMISADDGIEVSIEKQNEIINALQLSVENMASGNVDEIIKLKTGYTVDELIELSELLKQESKTEATKGNIYLLKGDFEEAIKHYNYALTKDPNNNLAYNNIAIVCLLQEDIGCAKSNFLNAILAEKENSLPYGNLGAVYAKEERLDSALYYSSMALSINGFDYIVLDQRAKISIELDMIDEAKKDITLAIEVYPRCAFCYKTLSRIYQYEKAYDKALSSINKAIEIASNNYRYLLLKGIILSDKEDYEQAISVYNESLDLVLLNNGNEKDILNIKYNIGLSFMRGRKINEVIEYFENLLEAYPDFHEGRMAFAGYLEKNARNIGIREDEKYINFAMSQYGYVIRNSENSFEARVRLGRMLIDSRRLAEAESVYEGIAEGRAEYDSIQKSKYLSQYGLLKYLKKDYESSVEYCEEAYRLNSTGNELVYQCLVLSLSAQGDYLKSFNRVIEGLSVFKTSCVLMEYAMGEAMNLGDFEKAIALYDDMKLLGSCDFSRDQVNLIESRMIESLYWEGYIEDCLALAENFDSVDFNNLVGCKFGALCLQRNGDYDKAVLKYKQIAQFMTTNGLEKDISLEEIYANLGAILKFQSKNKEALNYFKLAEVIDVKTLRFLEEINELESIVE